MNAARAVTVVVGYEDSHRRAIYSMRQRGGSLSGKRTDPDADLFREAMRDVKPIATRVRVPPTSANHRRKRALHRGRSRAWCWWKACRGSADGEITDTGDEISFRRAGVQDECDAQTEARRIPRRGNLRPARLARRGGKGGLREFLADVARAQSALRTHHSRQRHELGAARAGHQDRGQSDPAQDRTVLAFTSARRIDGGTGAINVSAGAAVNRTMKRINVFLSEHGSCRRSCVAGTNHNSQAIAANSRSCDRVRGRDCRTIPMRSRRASARVRNIGSRGNAQNSRATSMRARQYLRGYRTAHRPAPRAAPRPDRSARRASAIARHVRRPDG